MNLHFPRLYTKPVTQLQSVTASVKGDTWYWLDMNSPTDVTRESLLYRCGWSSFDGHRFKSSIAATIVNGKVVWDGSKILGEAGGK